MTSSSGIRTYLFNTARTLLGAAAYARSGHTPNFAYQSMVQLFCATGGASNDALSSWLAWTRRPYALSDACGILGNFSADDVERIGTDIRERGYHVFQQRLPDSLCDELLNYASTTPCIRRGTDDRGRTDLQLERFPRGNPDGIRFDFNEQELVNSPLIQGLMADRSFVAVAQNYLQAQPIVDVVAMWWNVMSPQPDKEAAQYWHFDMDRIKWLKFFVYLTDVGPENGPHSFVVGSHRAGGIPGSLLQKGYSRLTDEEVSSNYSANKFIEFTAPRGTVIAEDTRGLHKGKHVTKGDRLIFQMQFSNSLFGGEYPVSRVRQVKNTDLEDMIARFPRMYSNYIARS
jgi:Phytanoyl-CoA dioxygenase (PhyH)